MGIFDRFKKKAEKEIKPQPKGDIVNYSKESPDRSSEIIVHGLTKSGTITHRDGVQTQLVMGRIAKVIGSNAFYIDSSDYIAFEMPVGKTITEDMIIAAINQYEIDKNADMSENRAFYVGRVENGVAGNKSLAIQKAVEKEVALKIQKSQEEARIREENRRIEEDKAREKAQKEDEIRRREREAIENREKAERIQNFGINPTGSYQYNGKRLSDYDGVDMISGDILRLRQVDKVCKDSEGIYLYSAYVDRVAHEYDVEMIGSGEAAGQYVCFTLPQRLDDIIQSGNREQIGKVLQLLSGERGKNGELTYIGGIDRSGQINRFPMPDSHGISKKVEQMQQEYLAKNQFQMNRNSQRSYDDDAR